MIHNKTQQFIPRKFQTLVKQHYDAGHDVLLQAPTGSGKTAAAVRPALFGWRAGDPTQYPQSVRFVAPTRTLVGNHYTGLIEKCDAENSNWQGAWRPAIQTGLQPDDGLFERRFTIATVDQLLASFIGTPYGIPRRLDNINTGAMIGSYLIFDEFHLYPRNEMLTTVLAMLKMLKGISRFVLMSATCTPDLLETISNLLDAKLVRSKDDPTLFDDVKSVQSQSRTWYARDGALDADAVQRALGEIDNPAQKRHVICLCNTVERSQALYDGLKQADNLDVRALFHSRFYAADRTRIEKEMMQEFDKRKPEEPYQPEKPVVYVTTQVIEVGIDISCDVLLTECAPAASLVQRAGRCARREHENGHVYVYQPIQKDEDEDEDEDGNEQVNYAPYIGDEGEDETIAAATWHKLTSGAYQGQQLGYRQEQQLVAETHGTADKAWCEGLTRRVEDRIQDITDCMKSNDSSWIAKLIRRQSTVSLFIHRDPARTAPDGNGDARKTEDLTKEDKVAQEWQRNPHNFEAFSVSKGRLHRYMKQYKTAEVEAEWLLTFGENLTPAEQHEAEGSYERYKWHTLSAANDVYTARSLFAAHPLAMSYDAEYGLRFQPAQQPATSSPERKRKRHETYDIHAERYHEHITGLMLAYTNAWDPQFRHARLDENAAYALRVLCERCGVSYENAERYLRLTLALHDVGKLGQGWQDNARRWMAHRIEQSLPDFSFEHGISPDEPMPLGHTDFRKTDDDERRIQPKFGRQPPHAVEGATAVTEIVRDATGDDGFWMAVILGAIMRHHSAQAKEVRQEWQLAAGVRESFVRALEACGFGAEAERWFGLLVEKADPKHKKKDIVLTVRRITPQKRQESYLRTLMYYYFVRVLRLTDQRSGFYWRNR